MCYLESYDTISVNRKFVRLTNPTTALYFAELLVILKEVKRKNKYDPITGQFTLNRQYIFKEININTTEQKHCDEILKRLGIISVDPNNTDRLAVDVKRYFELLTDDSLVPEDLLPKTAKLTATEKKAITKAAIQKRIVDLFGETDDRAKEAVSKLVEVYFSKGVCKNSQWEPIIKMIHACTTDPEGIVELIDYILSTNYVSIPAAIDSFMKKHAPTATKLNSKQETCSGTLDGVEF